MPAIFLSHASRDDALASRLETWLRANGFDDLFVDHSDIRAGDKWTEALRRAKGSCRVVLCLVTPDWLASDECYGEFLAGWYAGRRMIPLFALDARALDEKQQARLERAQKEDQGLDLTKAGAPHAVDLDAHPAIAELFRAGLRAAGALARLGLDPRAFEVDKSLRPEPFPGLRSFGDTDADAAIFFGRSSEIARCLEDLREMRATGDRRVYAVLGGSGSGKSSLMKAGLLPRLRRERAWFVLRAFRPGIDPLTNFSGAIARTANALNIDISSGGVRDKLRAAFVNGAELRSVLDEIIAPLKLKADRPDATVLVTMDQAEELARVGGESADALTACIRAMLAEVRAGEPTPYAVALTLRTDCLPEVEASKRFEGLGSRSQYIRMMPAYGFDTAIEQPAARYGVEIEPALIEALMEDIGTEDALPILAFTLQRLWRQYQQEKRILKTNYESIGKLSGLIEDAAERALRGIDPLSPQRPLEGRLSDTRDRQAARVFLPRLAQVNERGVTVRRVAQMSNFDDEAKELLGAFDKWRLLVASQDGVEVAHEAMFREWPRFREWLAPEKARLEALRGLESAAASWDAKGRHSHDIVHRGRLLATARSLDKIADYKAELDRSPAARAYLFAASRAQARRFASITLVVLAALSVPFLTLELLHAIAAMKREAAADAAARYVATSPILKSSAEATGLPAGSVFRDCAGCPEMVVVAGGKFMMGSSTDDELGEKDEFPAHPEIIQKLAAGRFDVTFDEWQTCVNDDGCSAKKGLTDEGWGRGRRPMLHVTWSDAKAYAAWLSRRTGAPYRLPTESEWEYLARAGTSTPYWTGDSIDSSEANFNSGPQRTYPVGSYGANAFGLYDMVGNVWQWVEDCYVDTYTNAKQDGSAYEQPGCLERDLRGGSWIDLPRYLRSAQRFKLLFSTSGDSMGFRVVRDVRP